MEINSSTPINELVNTILANSRNDRDGANSEKNYYLAWQEVRKRSDKADKYDKLVQRLYERLMVSKHVIEMSDNGVLFYDLDGNFVNSLGGEITPERLAEFLAGEY